MALAFDAEDEETRPVIVFPDPNTAIDENGVKHTINRPPKGTPDFPDDVWHSAMGKWVRKDRAYNELEVLASDYYAKFPHPW